MRIALVTHKVDNHDGQGRVNFEIAMRALEEGHHVTVLGEYCSAEIADHPRGRFVQARKYRLPTQLLRNLYFAFTSARWLKKNRHEFDIVQANGFVTWEPADIVAIHFVHSAWLKNRYYPFQWLSFRPYAWYQRTFSLISSHFEKRTFRSAKVLIAVSKFTAQEVASLGIASESIVVINNGVDIREFYPGPAVRDSFGLPSDVPLALFVGDIRNARKNLDSVLKAMVPVADLHLVVAGKLEGSPFPALAEELGVSQRVHFIGKTSRIPDLMRSTDFFVFPSRYEAHPLVLLEAMASGLPVVVSGNFGAADYIHEAGMIFPDPNDVSELSARLRELAGSPGKRKTMSAAARAEAMEMQWSRTAQGYLDVYERFLREKGVSGDGRAAISTYPV